MSFDALVDHACVFHFRYATHDSISLGNCHPFPVEGNQKRKEVRADVAITYDEWHVRTSQEPFEKR